MGFNEVILADIELEAGPSPIPVGSYVFQLDPGAKYQVNQNSGEESLNLGFTVAEGDLAGRKTWVNYPDPTAITANGKNAGKPKTWSKQAMKKLQVALGHDPLPGETPADYFNRIAVGGNARITAQMAPGKFIKEGATEPRVEFNIFSVGPAA